jgi:hypothetical protein
MANTRKGDVAAIVGFAALAAGAYFFLGPDGKKHQKKMKGWMVKMKGEVLEKLEEMEEVTEPVYRQVVDTVARAQEVNDKIPRSEILALATDLKREWRSIRRLATHDKKKAKTVAKKTVRAAKSRPRKS